MAYLDTLKLVSGDTLPDLRLTVKDANTGATGKSYDENDSSTWAPMDITDGSCKLYIREVGSTTILKSLLGIIQDGENGVVVFSFQGSPFESSGVYEGEVEVTFSGGGVQTLYDLIKFNVRDEFA